MYHYTVEFLTPNNEVAGTFSGNCQSVKKTLKSNGLLFSDRLESLLYKKLAYGGERMLIVPKSAPFDDRLINLEPFFDRKPEVMDMKKKELLMVKITREWTGEAKKERHKWIKGEYDDKCGKCGVIRKGGYIKYYYNPNDKEFPPADIMAKAPSCKPDTLPMQNFF